LVGGSSPRVAGKPPNPTNPPAPKRPFEASAKVKNRASGTNPTPRSSAGELLSVQTRYSRKAKTFSVYVKDKEFDLETRIKLKRGRRLDDERVQVLKDFLVGIMSEALTGISFVQSNRKKIFREYCKARSNALRYIDTLDKLEAYGKKKPVPPEHIV